VVDIIMKGIICRKFRNGFREGTLAVSQKKKE
jgi:hypothetical protein